MKIVTIEGFEMLKIGYTCTHTHTPGPQLKIIFLDFLVYSEYSDTNISNFFFYENIASSVRKQNIKNCRQVSRAKKVEKNNNDVRESRLR